MDELGGGGSGAVMRECDTVGKLVGCPRAKREER